MWMDLCRKACNVEQDHVLGNKSRLFEKAVQEALVSLVSKFAPYIFIQLIINVVACTGFQRCRKRTREKPPQVATKATHSVSSTNCFILRCYVFAT